MAVNPFIDNLCQKAQEVFKILEETDCNLSDDTYLDHMIAGIKNEMTQYDNSNECLEFYRKSQCSRFVKSFKSASTGCQNFILKLLEEICMIHPDIQKEALQVALYVIENFETNKYVPSQAFLDLLSKLSDTESKIAEKDEVEAHRLLIIHDLNLWERLFQPIISMQPEETPNSHFWKISFINLAKNFIIGNLLYGRGHENKCIDKLYPNLVITPFGLKIFDEILEFFLISKSQSKFHKTFEILLKSLIEDNKMVSNLGLENHIKALIILNELDDARRLLKKQFIVDQYNGNTQAWYKSVKPFLESSVIQLMNPKETLADEVFRALRNKKDFEEISANSMIIAAQGLSRIKMGEAMKIEFEQHVFQILKTIQNKSQIGDIDITSSMNVRLISSLVTSINAKNRRPRTFDVSRFKTLCSLSKNSQLSIHLQARILESIQNYIGCGNLLTKDCIDISTQDIVIDLWSHSLSGSDWKMKDLLLNIIKLTFLNPCIPLTSKYDENCDGFPWTSLLNFVTSSLKSNSSFVRSTCIETISSILIFLSRYEDPGKNIVLESLKQLYGQILHIFSNDTEAVVRRMILRENILIRLHPKQEREAVYAGKLLLTK